MRCTAQRSRTAWQTARLITAYLFAPRASALCSDTHAAEMTRRHNNANILCLGGLVTEEKTALEIVDTFLKFDFEGGRHQRRIDQIADIENGRL